MVFFKGCTPEKQDGNIGGGGVGGSLTEGINGYLASPPPTNNKSIITITANPLHPEVRFVYFYFFYLSELSFFLLK